MRLPRLPRPVRVALQLGAVLAALALTVANSAAPPVRLVTAVKSSEGGIALDLDRRVYEDKRAARLPKGDYRSVTLVRYTDVLRYDRERHEQVVESRTSSTLFTIEAGDPRLEGADAGPIELELLPGMHAEREGGYSKGPYELRVTRADGSEAVVTFELQEVTK